MKISQVKISNDSFLFTSRIVVISQYIRIIERILTFASKESLNTRARDLSKKIKETRRRYEMKRMKSTKRLKTMNQSILFFTHLEFSYEYNLNISNQEEHEDTISFTFINRQVSQTLSIFCL